MQLVPNDSLLTMLTIGIVSSNISSQPSNSRLGNHPLKDVPAQTLTLLNRLHVESAAQEGCGSGARYIRLQAKYR